MYLFFLLLLFPFTADLFAQTTIPDTEWIAQRIFHNECGSSTEKLVWWNEGESFASLGIGHFIWYPENNNAPFVETFPALIQFLKTNGVKIPKWMQKECPWKSKAEFNAPSQNKKKHRLRKILNRTLSLQCAFIQQNFQQSISDLVKEIPLEQAESLQKKIRELSQTKKGRYALLDYAHFKGMGTSPTERYNEEGWGLKQVLEAMPLENQDALIAFVSAAENMLRKRVENAPPSRQENRWLPGWISRVHSYL